MRKIRSKFERLVEEENLYYMLDDLIKRLYKLKEALYEQMEEKPDSPIIFDDYSVIDDDKSKKSPNRK